MTCASGPAGLECLQRREAVETGHHHVEQHHVGRFALLHGREHLVAAGVAPGFVAAQRQERPKVGGEGRIVIDDGDVGLFHSMNQNEDMAELSRELNGY